MGGKSGIFEILKNLVGVKYDRKSGPSVFNSNAITTIDCIPTKVMQKIFENMSYYDLKVNVRLVSRRFHGIVGTRHENHILDKKLFRDGPITRALSTKFTLHPCFDLMVYNCSTRLEDCYFYSRLPSTQNTRKEEEWINLEKLYLVSLPVRSKNATSPATDRVMLHVMKEAPFRLTIKDGSAVTVRHVMLALVNFFSSTAFQCRNGLTMTRAENLAGRFRWTGFNRMVVTSGGVVHLFIDDMNYLPRRAGLLA